MKHRTIRYYWIPTVIVLSGLAYAVLLYFTLGSLANGEGDECILVIPSTYDGKYVTALAHPNQHDDFEGLVYCPQK